MIKSRSSEGYKNKGQNLSLIRSQIATSIAKRAVAKGKNYKKSIIKSDIIVTAKIN